MRVARWLGSIRFGIVLMVLVTILLVWGTFVEAVYGAATARFVFYDSLAFAVLLGAIAVNVTAAMIVRLPRVRQCWAFLMTHLGIVVLLVGSLLTRQWGEEANLALFEGENGSVAVKSSRCLRVTELPLDGDSLEPRHTSLPFVPGPWSWSIPIDPSEANPERLVGPLAASLAATLRCGLALQRWEQPTTFWIGEKNTSKKDSRARVDVIDYLANTETLPAPPLELTLRVANAPRDESLSLAIPLYAQHGIGGGVSLRGARETARGGHRITFAVAESNAEADAFRNVNDTLENTTESGAWGKCVLRCQGEVIVIDVEEMLQRMHENPTGAISLGSRGLRLEQFRLLDRLPMISFEVVATSGLREAVRLFADAPEMNVHANIIQVFGSYFFDPSARLRDASTLDPRIVATYRRLAQPRLDLLQSPRGDLLWRYWDGKQSIAGGDVPLLTHGSDDMRTSRAVAVAAEEASLTFTVQRFVPHDIPGGRFRAATISRDPQQPLEPRVKLRLTTPESTEEFWLRELVSPRAPQQSDQTKWFLIGRQATRIVFTAETLDLGFTLRLHRFIQQNEPGTRMAAGFTSIVEEVSPNSSAEPSQRTVIRMNAPGTFRSAITGRVYRVYQASRSGPYRAGDPAFAELYDGELFPGEETPREEIWQSVLSVNADPGRGLKYLGCFLLIVGTAAMMVTRR